MNYTDLFIEGKPHYNMEANDAATITENKIRKCNNIDLNRGIWMVKAKNIFKNESTLKHICENVININDVLCECRLDYAVVCKYKNHKLKQICDVCGHDNLLCSNSGSIYICDMVMNFKNFNESIKKLDIILNYKFDVNILFERKTTFEKTFVRNGLPIGEFRVSNYIQYYYDLVNDILKQYNTNKILKYPANIVKYNQEFRTLVIIMKIQNILPKVIIKHCIIPYIFL